MPMPPTEKPFLYQEDMSDVISIAQQARAEQLPAPAPLIHAAAQHQAASPSFLPERRGHLVLCGCAAWVARLSQPARAGGPWLRTTFPIGLVAAVVPSARSLIVHPWR